MIDLQVHVTEWARLKMLEIMERYRITETSESSMPSKAAHATKAVLEAETRIIAAKIFVQNLSELNTGDLLRTAGSKLTGDPFFETAVNAHREELAQMRRLEATYRDDSPHVIKAKQRLAEREKVLSENVHAARRSLSTELAMANQEMVLAAEMLESKNDDLMDFSRKRAEYDRHKRDYERQLRGLEILRERELTQRLDHLENRPAKISLELHDVSLADALDYADCPIICGRIRSSLERQPSWKDSKHSPASIGASRGTQARSLFYTSV